MSRSLILGVLLLAAALFVPGMALAQDSAWLADRRYTEGIGIRVGDFELHPGAAAEVGYDSNYFYRADSPDEGPAGSVRFKITPSLSLSTIGAQRREGEGDGGSPPSVSFRAGIHATYDEFIPTNGNASGQQLLKNQRNVEGALDFNLGILPGRVVSGTLHGTFTRGITPSNAGDTTASFNRDSPEVGAEVAITPGLGTLDWRFGYDFIGTFFESGTYSNLNNFNHQIITRGRWRFLPRSALTFDGSVGFINYPASGAQKTGSHPIRARLGFNGLITNIVALTVMGGWGASFYTPTPQEDFDSFIGLAELKFLLTPSAASDPAGATLSLSSLSIGFNRDFSDSYIGTYVETDKGFAKFSYFFAGRFLLVLEADVSANRFPKITIPIAHAAWTDVPVAASIFGEYRFAKVFAVNATLSYGNNISSTVLSAPGAPVGFEALQWQDFQGYLGFRWFM
jgi:hypothetical protein